MSDPAWALPAPTNRADAASIFGVSLDKAHDGNEPAGPVEDGVVERARRGDKDAFGELYKQHHGAIYRLVRFYVPDAADDLAAETFMRAWKGLPRYRYTGAPFLAWLYGIARHVVADEQRRRARTEVRGEIEDRAHEDNHEERLMIAALIARLPKEQRDVIEMKYLLGMRNPEVARLLKKTIGAVNAMQWRALQSLRALMEEVS